MLNILIGSNLVWFHADMYYRMMKSDKYLCRIATADNNTFKINTFIRKQAKYLILLMSIRIHRY
jgi:hypothetical protein